jgi:hypothetical protein
MRIITSMIDAFSITDLNSPNLSSIFRVGFTGLSGFGENSVESGACCELDIECAFLLRFPASYVMPAKGGLKVLSFQIRSHYFF